MRKKQLGNRGTVAILTAMLGTVTIGFTALATDVAVWQLDSAGMQGAADHASLAAALTLSAGITTATAEARAVAAAEGFVHGSGTTTVTVNSPATKGPNAGVANSVEVVVQQTEPMFFGKILMAALPSASSRAVTLPGNINACMLALEASGLGFNAATEGQIHAEPCDLFVNSKSACGLTLSNDGAYYFTNVVVGMPDQNGCESEDQSMNVTGTETFSAPSTADPYSARPIPLAVGCQTAGPFDGKDKVSIGPGTYCNGIVLDKKAELTLRTGVYVFDHGLFDIRSGDATIKLDPADGGAGVSLVFTSSNGLDYAGFNIKSSANLQLTPMKTGPTAGILIWYDGAGAKPYTIGDGALAITGAIYSPGSSATFTGKSSIAFTCGQVIANSISLASKAAMTFTKNNCDQYNMAGYSSTAASGGYTLRE